MSVHILDLTRSTCRWPMWKHTEQPTQLFCGAQIIGHSPYCAVHTAMAFSSGGNPAARAAAQAIARRAGFAVVFGA